MLTYAYICDTCKRTTELRRPAEQRNMPVRCECGEFMRRDYQAEQGHMRQGDLPDWVSVNAGFLPADIPRARQRYAHLGVTVDAKGNAHVPGKNRRRFLKERGLCEL